MIVGSRVQVDTEEIIKYETTWDEQIITFFSNHRVKDIEIVPGTGYIVLATEFFKNLIDTNKQTISISNVTFKSFIVIDEMIKNTKICFDYNQKTEMFSISSVRKGGDVANVHAFMKVTIHDITDNKETITMPEIYERIECGKSFYETLANKYTAEFAMLQNVFRVNQELYSTLSYETIPAVSSLRLIAMLDVSTHIGMTIIPTDQRMIGLVFKSVENCRFNSSFFQLSKEKLQKVHVKVSISSDGHGNDITLFNSDGILCQLLNCEVLLGNNHIPTMFIDKWVMTTKYDMDISVYKNIYYASDFDIQSFHKTLDFNKRQPFILVCEEENSFSSYSRSLRFEYPDWNVLVIYSSNKINPSTLRVPANEPEIKITDDGILFVRRLEYYNSFAVSSTYSNAGVYVITGGLGYVGRNLAKSIYENGGKKIILLSSTKNSLPSDWEYDFTPDVYKCDVRDKNDVLTFFSSLTEPVEGIIHAAGVLSDKTLPNLTDDDWKNVFQVKVTGAINIDSVLRQLMIEPSFVVLCSSIASSFGSAGQANYAAANGALDALARKRDRYYSIQWGAWVGGGMAVDETMHRSARIGMLGLTCDNACKYFKRVIHNDQKVVVICPLNSDKLPSIPYFSQVSTKINHDQAITINLEEIKKNTDPEQVLGDHIKTILQELGIDDISIDIPLVEGGLDSLSALEFQRILEKRMEITLSETIVFDFPSIKKLVRYLLTLNNSVTKTFPMENVELFDPIAIIAMACEYPQNIDCPRALFDFLDNGGDAISDIPLDRFDASEYPNIYVKKGAFLESMMTFDNEMFHISEAEARQMDPQQRKCLELTSELLSHLQPKTMSELEYTGVFVTGATNAELSSCDMNSPYTSTGSSFAVISNRISYTFGMRGPSMSIDTACSSSLVAIDVACKALSNYDCKQAIVIAGNYLNAGGYIGTCSSKMLSPDGRCATFSSQANGYARAEGFGGIVLKRLVDAIRDKDNICAVISSTAVVQDGRSANLTSPNGPSQEECISLALARAKLTVNDIDFVETHGTGTDLGDPIEVNALCNVFGIRSSPLPLGAVKSNMGHMESGAGMVGVLKAIMCMKHRRLTKNIHCDEINDKIKKHIESKKIVVPNTEHFVFDNNKEKFHAGVSSFGFGGTNAHIILSFMH